MTPGQLMDAVQTAVLVTVVLALVYFLIRFETAVRSAQDVLGNVLDVQRDLMGRVSELERRLNSLKVKV